MEEYVYNEIEPQHRIYVWDEPLAEYAEGRVESLTIEPDCAYAKHAQRWLNALEDARGN